MSNQTKYCKSVTNLYRFLENLLEWSQIQQGAIPFNPVIIQLGTFVGENIAMIQEVAKNNDIEMQIEISDQLEVFADQNMLQIIFRNLGSNAVKFTHKGGTVSLSSKITSENSVEVSIKDSGIGMSIDNTISIFATDVDPIANLMSLPTLSCSYAVASYQLFNYLVPYMPSGAYSAEFVKLWTLDMQVKIQNYGTLVSS